VRRQAAGATLLGVVLSAWLTWPTIGHPGSMARIDTGDGRFSVWNVAWVAHALVDEPSALFDANIFYPHTGTLVYSEANLVAGAMAAPVYALTRNPIAAHNVVVFVAFVLSFVAMWALSRRLTGDPLAALVPATAFTFSPFVAARTPHIQLLMIFVFPVTLLAMHRFVDRPGAARGAVLGASLALAALACGYYGIFAGLAVGLGILWFAHGQPAPRRYWGGTAVALLVPVLLVGPVLRPYLTLRDEAGARQAADVNELRDYSADWRAYLTSPARAHQWIIRLAGIGKEVLFPGGVVLLLAGVAAWTRRRRGPAEPPGGRRVLAFYAALGACGLWASFGPDAGLYAVLDWGLPFMSFLRAPARFGVLVVLALSVMAGFAMARLELGRRRAWLVGALVLLVGAEVSAAPWPLRRVPEVPPAYRMLAELPRGPVVEFHFPYRPTDLFNHTRSMFWSMWHWQPLINGYSDYIPPDFREIVVPINGFPDAASFRILEDRGARYVVVHLDEYEGAAREVLLARFPDYARYLRPLLRSDDTWLFEIASFPPGPPR
jgi:hypothetical protein